MEAVESKSLPENAYVPLKEGEVYAADGPGGAEAAGDHGPLGHLGALPLRHLHGRLGVLRPEGRAGDGGGDPDLDPRDRPRARLSSAARPFSRTSSSRASAACRARSSRARSSRSRRSTPSSSTRIRSRRSSSVSPAACLGVLFLIPLRRYFVRETHGEFPYPEATAITEVLVTGEKGGSQAKLLLQATGIAGGLRLLRHDVPGLEGVRRLPVHPGDAGPRRARRRSSSASTRSPSSSASATSWGSARR